MKGKTVLLKHRGGVGETKIGVENRRRGLGDGNAASGARFSLQRDVEGKLNAELERLENLLGLGHWFKVVWAPDSGGELSGEVKGNTIYIYEREVDAALQTLRHELVDYLLTSKIVEPLVGLVNVFIKYREAEIYREKERLVEIFSKSLSNDQS